jgi:2-oxoglutarate ferredoxin oxidoreductase subunit delta
MAIKGRVVISELYCKGCELCICACPQGSLALAANKINAKGYHPAVLLDDHCTGCAICAVVCPEAAITVYRETVRNRQLVAEVG